MKALPYLLTKEYKQMFRNWLLPVVFILLPIAMMNVVPRIATQEVKNLNIAVIDCDHSTLSSRLTTEIAGFGFFQSLCYLSELSDSIRFASERQRGFHRHYRK